jgi:flagellar basal body rod protein FlgC
MLNSALNSSLSALRASSAGLNTVSQNIANAGNENYTAIESVFSSNQLGGVSIEPSFNRNEGLNRRRAYQESSRLPWILDMIIFKIFLIVKANSPLNFHGKI